MSCQQGNNFLFATVIRPIEAILINPWTEKSDKWCRRRTPQWYKITVLNKKRGINIGGGIVTLSIIVSLCSQQLCRWPTNKHCRGKPRKKQGAKYCSHLIAILATIVTRDNYYKIIRRRRALSNCFYRGYHQLLVLGWTLNLRSGQEVHISSGGSSATWQIRNKQTSFFNWFIWLKDTLGIVDLETGAVKQ